MNRTCPSSKMVHGETLDIKKIPAYRCTIFAVPAVQTYALSLFKAGRNIIIS